MAGLRRAPRVDNIGEGRTVNKGLGVRGDGGTVRETTSGQGTGARGPSGPAKHS
jgi:hypothetical protein